MRARGWTHTTGIPSSRRSHLKSAVPRATSRDSAEACRDDLLGRKNVVGVGDPAAGHGDAEPEHQGNKSDGPRGYAPQGRRLPEVRVPRARPVKHEGEDDG